MHGMVHFPTGLSGNRHRTWTQNNSKGGGNRTNLKASWLKYSTLTHQKITLAIELLPASASWRPFLPSYAIVWIATCCQISASPGKTRSWIRELVITPWIAFLSRQSWCCSQGLHWHSDCFEICQPRRTVWSISWPHSSYHLIEINVGTW